MKPAPFAYHDPTTREEALALFARLDNARALAGGQSLVPMMNFRYAMPDHLVDLNGIAELAQITMGATIELGSMVRQRDVEFAPDLARVCPILREALLHVGHRQTRNRGTLGGSLCHADPSAETPAIMLLHDATLTLDSSRGAREIAMEQFGQGFMTTDAQADEILTRISFAPWREGHLYGFQEFARRHGDFAICSAGVLIETDARGDVARLAVCLGGVAPTPVRLRDVEKAAVGHKLDQALIAAIADAAERIDAMSDAHVAADYRQHLAGVMTRRALASAFAQRESAHV